MVNTAHLRTDFGRARTCSYAGAFLSPISPNPATLSVAYRRTNCETLSNSHVCPWHANSQPFTRSHGISVQATDDATHLSARGPYSQAHSPTDHSSDNISHAGANLSCHSPNAQPECFPHCRAHCCAHPVSYVLRNVTHPAAIRTTVAVTHSKAHLGAHLC